MSAAIPVSCVVQPDEQLSESEARWVPLSPDNDWATVDSRSVLKTSDSTYKLWTRDKSTDSAYTVFRWEVNCSSRRFRGLAYRSYLTTTRFPTADTSAFDRVMGERFVDSAWKEPEPEFWDEWMLDGICGYVKDR